MNRQAIEATLTRWWYQPYSPLLLLWPLSFLFGLIVRGRRLLYRMGVMQTKRVSVPVIVVGNITVGGTGKSPLVAHLAQHLKTLGYRPGILLRGYGATLHDAPALVTEASDPSCYGDEAVMLAKQTGVPVAVCVKRYLAAKYLANEAEVDIIISDDGLQHYALHRDIEIAVVDQARRFGNRLLLPAGPLREPMSRLDTVDIVVENGEAVGEHVMQLLPVGFKSVQNDKRVALTYFKNSPVRLVAGIGSPERFFSTMKQLAHIIEQKIFPDHYQYQVDSLKFSDHSAIIMTAKDAVKCQPFATDNMWMLETELQLNKAFYDTLNRQLTRVREEHDRRKIA